MIIELQEKEGSVRLSDWSRYIAGEIVHFIASQVPPEEQAKVSATVALVISGNSELLKSIYVSSHKCSTSST